ncbi:hypothetical protein RAJCM14343_4724 [Rhodococcus aetherivorans]|uniref:Uncharacterized protein n=1 Tax=Rhodococcus aetherivorans TaxID=191292 RepID=A0ABQ0YS65_9NOCA|nr:hypothetical protein RAJCM14343_4724 [Rhodococcus aetherivorans]
MGVLGYPFGSRTAWQCQTEEQIYSAIARQLGDAIGTVGG